MKTLEYVTTNPYLGITISKDLKWNSHSSTITKKANSTHGFLRRNIRRCPIKSKRTACIARVRAVLEYGAIVWDPYHRGDKNKLEKPNTVQLASSLETTALDTQDLSQPCSPTLTSIH